MTTQKDFKRLVRGRMQKTGESYTSARGSLLRTSAKRQARSVERNGHQNGAAAIDLETVKSAPAAAPVADFAKIAGMSDETVKAKTGCTWERWVWALDAVNAHQWPHGEIAEYIHEKYKVPGWWTQTVTVGYERIRGLRARGQRRSGSWEASKSRTIDAAVGALFKAFKQPKLRSAWLPGKTVAVRTSVPNKSMRITWEDGSSVELYFTSKGRSKSSVTVQHTKLPNKETSERMKAYWAQHLDVLAGQFSKKHAGPKNR
jgi:uncharacterized protein YndB with AHSA1/START domain